MKNLIKFSIAVAAFFLFILPSGSAHSLTLGECSYVSQDSLLLKDIEYSVANNELKKAFEQGQNQSNLQLNAALDTDVFIKERERLFSIAKKIDPAFEIDQLKFLVETIPSSNSYSVVIEVHEQTY